MKEYIAFDVHKHYTLATVEDTAGELVRENRIQHQRGLMATFLSGCEAGSGVAVETVGNWYWIVDEIEATGFTPLLVNARKAKLMIGSINKTDKLDNRGINRLQRSGTLPTVWIPPAEVRDLRDLPRTRMVLVRQRTQLKNRIQAALSKYGLTVSEVKDTFGKMGRELLEQRIAQLPPHTRHTTGCLLAQLDSLERQITALEQRIGEVMAESPASQLLQSIPGVGPILSTVIASEIGRIERFARPEQLASYSGTTPRVHSSGGKTRYGPLRPDVNRYLKFAFIEAANVTALHAKRHPERHISRLYLRIKMKKGHAKAVGAVARHMAEATFWILSKEEPYKAPVSPTRG
jgi:transposase